MLVNLHPAGTPQSRGWGSGWPHSPSGSIVNVVWKNGASPAGGVRSEIATLVRLLGNETIRRGYSPRAGWCWGYDNRAISGTSTPSNHSWGLAIDINAPTNPRMHSLHTDMPSWMPDLWNNWGFRWGGDYDGDTQKDPMHYEFMGTRIEAAVLTAAARVRFALLPKPKPVIPTDGDTVLITRNDNGALTYWLLSGGKMASVSQADAKSFTGPRLTVTGDVAWAHMVALFPH